MQCRVSFACCFFTGPCRRGISVIQGYAGSIRAATVAVLNCAERYGLLSLSLRPVPVHPERGKRGKVASGIARSVGTFTAIPHPLRVAILQVEPLMGDQDPEPLCEVSRGISLFPQRPPLQAHPPAMRLSWSLHPDISGAQVVLGSGQLLGALWLLACTLSSRHAPTSEQRT